MTHDGAHNVEQAASQSFEILQQGMRQNRLSDAVESADRGLASSGLSETERRQVGQMVAQQLETAGLLPRVMVEYGQSQFKDLSNGDHYIHAQDLDSRLMSGIETYSPIKGMIARSLRNRIDEISLQHEDASSFHDDRPSRSDEIAKGISTKDLSEWGQEQSNGRFHTQMSRQMLSSFGSREKWLNLAGPDGLLEKGELDRAKRDSMRFGPDEKAVLDYMRENYGGIRAARDGDNWNKMTLSDVLDWSAKHGADPQIGLEQPEFRPRMGDVNFTVDPRDKVGGASAQGLDAIEVGFKNHSLSDSLRAMDQHLTSGAYTPQEVAAITGNIEQSLAQRNLMGRVMGEYGSQNFDSLNNINGNKSYIHASELDTVLQSNIAARSPLEAMVLRNMRNNVDAIAMLHNDVTNDDSDRAEQSRGISKGDLRDLTENTENRNNDRAMSARMLANFGRTEDFQGLAGSDNVIKENELEAARNDTFKYNPEQRAVLGYMLDNYGTIRHTVDGDGRGISISDMIGHAAKFGVRPEDVFSANAAPPQEQEGVQLDQGQPERVVQRDLPVEGQPVERQPVERQPVERQPVERQPQRPRLETLDIDPRLGAPNETKSVKIERSDRFWNMANRKYGYPAIEAIFEANGLKPQAVQNGNSIELRDPDYVAGREYVLPSQDQIPELTQAYRARASQMRDQFSSRVGPAECATDVKLIYGDTLSKLALQKYGRNVPIEALYEANNLPPRIVNDNGCIMKLEPIYYAGRTYVLPPADQIEALADAYRRKHFQG
ncbi:MAG: LysM peptidoglycan-binding domain-containing protein [Cyanobacteria bacterium HKST-UBA02]|nr:LysM peptidoglycan-binding domain-containing protein [Cyanobacteria bacterium HKST-UBA02]